MITFFRNFTKTFAFKAIMGLLVIGLAVFGLQDVFNANLTNEVIRAGNRTINATEFRQAFDTQKANMEQQNGGQPLSTEDAVKANLHIQLLNQIAQEAAFQSWLEDSGLKPSDKLITDQLKKFPRFFNQISGQFDKNAYVSALREANITEASFEKQLRDSIAAQQFGAAAVAGIKAPKIMAALQTVNELQSRDVRYFVVDSSHLPAAAEPTEAQLTAFYNEMKPRITRPELREFTIVSFAPGDFAQSTAVDEAELKKMYDFRKDTLSKAETRSFVQITAPDAKAAAAISTALKAGQEPQAVANANKGTLITFAGKPLTAVPDRKVGNMAFSLPAGEVSGPIQGDLGFAVVKINAIQPGSVTTFEAARPQLVEEYKRQQATDKVYKMVEDFEKTRETGTPLLEAAQKLGARITPMPPMSAEGQAINGQNFAQFEKVIKSAFSLAQGGESDIQETGTGEYYAVKVTKVTPPFTPPLNDLKPQLVAGYKARELDKALQSATDKAVSRLNSGEDPAKVAASYGATLASADGVEYQTVGARIKVSDNPQVGQALGGRVFTAKPKESFSLRFAQQQTLVGIVTKATPPAQEKAINSMPIATMMGARMLGSDLFQQSVVGSNAKVKPKIYPNVALKALGVTPETAGAKKDIAAQ